MTATSGDHNAGVRILVGFRHNGVSMSADVLAVVLELGGLLLGKESSRSFLIFPPGDS